MIIKFKLFESENNIAKFDIDDEVYIKNDKTNVKCKIKEIDYNSYNIVFYILHEYPHMKIREDQLIPSYEVDAKKYNL